jgi:hypothetical protein
MHTKFLSDNLEGKDHLEDQDLEEDNIRNHLAHVTCMGADWIIFAKDRATCRFL